MNYVSSPMKINRFELLSCDTNENQNLDLREKYKTFNQTEFKVTQPTVSETTAP